VPPTCRPVKQHFVAVFRSVASLLCAVTDAIQLMTVTLFSTSYQFVDLVHFIELCLKKVRTKGQAEIYVLSSSQKHIRLFLPESCNAK
jgi:hypothetical protein